MMRSALAPALLALGGCETMAASGSGKCDASRAKMFVGALATPQVGRKALQRTGARTLRWIASNAAVTMDYREDRLNIRTDARNFIVRIDCG